MLALMNSERFMDDAPRTIYARLLDEDQDAPCHWRTMYRILDEQGQVRERRNQLAHPVYAKPMLMATAPNQTWTWDITKMRGPSKWISYNAYVLLDLYSRYMLGWLIADNESGEHAATLVETVCTRYDIQRNTLTLHADNGGPMKSKTLYQLTTDLGVTRSHSRPHTSNDNPFSESQFKTMKYRADYPDRFETLQASQIWMRSFGGWYNNQHHHSELALFTPADVYFGRVDGILDKRQAALDLAFAAHPERYSRGRPIAKRPPAAVYINPPAQETPTYP